MKTERIRIEAASRLLADQKWIGKVEDKMDQKSENTQDDIPEGTFTGVPADIASTLKEKSKDLPEAVKRLQFYINRAGKNLLPADEQRLGQAKDALYRAYGQPAPEPKPAK